MSTNNNPPKNWNPIVFFDPPNPAPTQPQQTQPQPLVPCIEDEPTVPSFCDPSLPPEFSGTGTPSAPLQVSTANFTPQKQMPTPAFRRQSPISYTPQPQATPSRKQRTPRPYGIAQELILTKLPLKMVNNALYAFDGKIYRFVSAPVMNQLIMAYGRHYVEAVGDASIIERVYKVIQAEPGIVYRPPRQVLPYVALEDCLVDLDTLTPHPFSPDIFVTTKLNGSFSRGATSTCPMFDEFLRQVTGGDKQLIERIWQAIGYAIVPDVSGKCLFLLQGVSNSGKSLLGSLIESLVDEDLVTSLDLTAMGERFGPSELIGKTLCTALDLPSGALDPKAVSLLKQLTGGDTITVDVKYQARIKFRCQTTFVLATNHAFLTRDADSALFDRIVTIPFPYSVPPAQRNRNLRETILATEQDAIIYRGLQAYQRVRRVNYQFAGDFKVNGIFDTNIGATMDYAAILWDFVKRYCVPQPGTFATTAQLYALFVRVTGVSWPGGINKFSAEISSLFDQILPGQIQKDRRRPGTGGNPERGFTGIAISAAP